MCAHDCCVASHHAERLRRHQVQVGVRFSVCSAGVLNVRAARMFVFGSLMISEYTCDDFRRLSELVYDEHVVNRVQAH